MRPINIIKAKRLDDELHIFLLTWWTNGKETVIRADGYNDPPNNMLTQFNDKLKLRNLDPLTPSEEFLIKILIL